MHLLLTIEFDGTNYAGWQRQKNAFTVQEALEDAIKTATGKECGVVGAGRTDAGVHAYGQCAHFDIETTIPPEKMAFALNLVLPEDIRVKESRQVRDDFHARKNARAKHYRYCIYCAEQACAINRNFCHHIRGDLNIEAMKTAASYLKGRHDFAAFQSAGSSVQDTVRTIYTIEVNKINEYVYIDVVGNGFLYNMVRIIAGTLIEVGNGRRHIHSMQQILESADRENAGPTAPAKGLSLVSVIYDHNSLIY